MSKIVFNELENTPQAQPEGATMLYSKSDGYLYAKNGATAERPLDKPIDVHKQGTVLLNVLDDEHWDKVTLLLPCDQMPVSDHTGGAIVRNLAHISHGDDLVITGTVTLNTSIKKYGAGSYLFGGSADYLKKPVNRHDDDFGDQDFTIECWFYQTGDGAGYYRTLLSTCNANDGFYLTAGDDDLIRKPLFYCGFTGGNTTLNSADAVPLNEWHHIAAVRDGSQLRLYVDGAQKDSTDISGSYTYDGSRSYVSIGDDNIGAQSFKGHMDDVRITRGVCRYPNGTTFTPPGELPSTNYQVSTVVTNTSGYNASQPGWSTADGENENVYTTSTVAKVGIGTASPAHRLELADGNIQLSNNSEIRFKDSTGVQRTFAWYKSDNELEIWNSGGGINIGASGGSSVKALNTAKKWVAFAGDSMGDTAGSYKTVQSSVGVTSVEEVAVGQFYIHFNGNMADDDYVVAGTVANEGWSYNQGFTVVTRYVGSVHIRTHDYNSTQEQPYVGVVIFGN